MSNLNGLEDLGEGYEMDAYAPIDGLAEDYEFFGLGQGVMNMENFQKMGIAAVAGGGGLLAVQNIMDRIVYLQDKPWMRIAAELLIAGVGGGALYQVNPAAGVGFAGGVGGFAVYETAITLMAQMGAENGNGNGNDAPEPGTEGMGYTEVHDVPSYRKLDRVSVPAGWEGGRAPLGRDLVTRANYQQINGLEGEASDLSTWIS